MIELWWIRDNKLSKKMQLEFDLTLTKAIEPARQSESVKKQQPTGRGQDKEQVAVEAIRKRHDSSLGRDSVKSGLWTGLWTSRV